MISCCNVAFWCACTAADNAYAYIRLLLRIRFSKHESRKCGHAHTLCVIVPFVRVLLLTTNLVHFASCLHMSKDCHVLFMWLCDSVLQCCFWVCMRVSISCVCSNDIILRIRFSRHESRKCWHARTLCVAVPVCAFCLWPWVCSILQAAYVPRLSNQSKRIALFFKHTFCAVAHIVCAHSLALLLDALLHHTLTIASSIWLLLSRKLALIHTLRLVVDKSLQLWKLWPIFFWYNLYKRISQGLILLLSSRVKARAKLTAPHCLGARDYTRERERAEEEEEEEEE